MEDKELVKILKDICHFAVEDGECGQFSKCDHIDCYFIKEQVAKILALGYRKVPSGEPPVLSPDQISEVVYLAIEYPDRDMSSPMKRLQELRAVAQAQRDADVRFFKRNQNAEVTTKKA